MPRKAAITPRSRSLRYLSLRSPGGGGAPLTVPGLAVERGYQQISGLRPRCSAVNPLASGRFMPANMLGAVAHVLIELSAALSPAVYTKRCARPHLGRLTSCGTCGIGGDHHDGPGRVTASRNFAGGFHRVEHPRIGRIGDWQAKDAVSRNQLCGSRCRPRIQAAFARLRVPTKHEPRPTPPSRLTSSVCCRGSSRWLVSMVQTLGFRVIPTA